MQNEPNRTDDRQRMVAMAVIAATTFSPGVWLYQGHATQAARTGKSENSRAHMSHSLSLSQS